MSAWCGCEAGRLDVAPRRAMGHSGRRCGKCHPAPPLPGTAQEMYSSRLLDERPGSRHEQTRCLGLR